VEYKEIIIPVGSSQIHGNLTLIPDSKSLVIFAHGSGSSRLSKRNQFVADFLHQSHISTFLFDLLTEQEDVIDQYTREFRFDIPLLADRLILVTRWLQENQKIASVKLGYFGASTGAAAALIAAAKLPEAISAVVSRGGRPDLAGDYLTLVQCPTALIVGELDYEVITLNKLAYEKLRCLKELFIVPDATHLFEEKDTLRHASLLARDWFIKFL
jgi:putative phosphoribosyl transferase